jgi:hypothetical protein
VGHRPTGDEYRIRNAGEYLGMRERKQQEAAESLTMRSFILSLTD